MLKSDLVDCIEKEMSIREIGEKLSVSYTTVRYWLKKHNLKTKVIRISEKWREENLRVMVKKSYNHSEVLRNMGFKGDGGGSYRSLKKYIKLY